MRVNFVYICFKGRQGVLLKVSHPSNRNLLFKQKCMYVCELQQVNNCHGSFRHIEIPTHVFMFRSPEVIVVFKHTIPRNS